LDLNKEVDLQRKFDLVWSIEVVEHIHPHFVDNLMRSFVNHADRIVLSAAKPGQGGEGHFNEQPDSYWIALFERYGFKFDSTNTLILRGIDEEHSENMFVFYR
jgi:hypothetical protein